MTTLIETGQTMTSLQIAEITGKNHFDVLKAIRKMEPAWEKVTASKFACKFKITEIGNNALRETPYYELTKTECLYIATKFNDEARARLILRWEQLENEKATRQQPEKGEVLPPPIDNSLPNNALVETINGKAVTTSRKLAAVLGREHSDVLRTIKNNLGNRRLHHYQFTSRDYRTNASGRSYEFLITRKGLDALAGVMRYGAKDKIKEAYKGAWQSRGTAVVPVLPMPEPLEAEEEMPEPGVTALPMLPMPEDIEEATKPAQAETASDESDEEIVYTPKQQKYIDWLEGYNEVLVDRLNKTKATKELYADLYENEKKRRLRNGEAMGYWHDLYEDLMFRLLGKDDGPLAEKMEAHATFRKRISKG